MNVPSEGHLLIICLIYHLGWRVQPPRDFSSPYANYNTLTAFSLHFPPLSLQDQYWQAILSIFIGLPHEKHPVSLNPKCSNYHVETNSLSIFSTFNPWLLVIFSFFCIGSHGNKSVGRESVTPLLAFCTNIKSVSWSFKGHVQSLLSTGQEETTVRQANASNPSSHRMHLPAYPQTKSTDPRGKRSRTPPRIPSRIDTTIQRALLSN